MSKEQQIGYISAILAAVLFGSVSTIAKPTLESIHPLVLAFTVYFLASLVSTPFAKNPAKSIEKNSWMLIILIAIFGAVIGPSLYFLGLESSLASDATLLANGEIIFSIVFAIIFFRENLQRLGFLAVGLLILGIIIITTDLQFSEQLFEPTNFGNFAIILATLFWALDNNLSKILSQKINLARIIQLKSAIGGGILLVLVLAFGIPINISIEQIPTVLFLGGAGFGLSIYLFLQGLKRIGTIRTIMLFSTSTIFGIFFAAIFLSEQISQYQIIAAAVMIGGIYLLHREDRK